ncbi:hypothetical protein MLD38_027006 [Melastoma candidum]|uniref:Uncharacterized protein n=1 Tax=Melastoma candidum TaxID=119954 RepID=A0ACB9P0U5_9MYRT|nr:hypothetical protein MLD38_027006 [Melastoma candidum]
MGSSLSGRREVAPSMPTRYTEISHFFHPRHSLLFECSELPFKCDGCEEVGIGSRYRCTSCDFDLHVPCAIPTPTIAHPFYPKWPFQLLPRPPGDVPRYCNAREKDVPGFVYHCRACGFDLHPCCAKLPTMLDDGRVQLYLYRKVSARCNRCGRKGRSWSYRSTWKKYNLHVACVRELLVASWQEIYHKGGKGFRGRPASPARIPSLRDTLDSGANSGHGRRKSKSKKEKYSEVADLALQFVISAVLGDPTTLIAGVIGSLIARS